MKIPKIIHQVWIGPKEPPIKPMDTWKNKHPDFEYIRWNESEFEKRDMNFECQDKIDSMEQYCGKVDIMRLELLYKYGGVFLDADSVCIEPIDYLLNNNFMIYENEKVRKDLIANGIMGFVPKHPFIKKCINFIKNNEVSQSKTGLLPWQITGPTLVTKIYDKDIFNDIRILPSYTFLPIHNTGLEYQGHGKVYSHQLWGSTNWGKFDMSGSIPKQFLKPEDEVSIVIPSYNTNIRYVNECLMSIKKQIGYIGMEIVWIDDGSDELNSTLLKKALEEFEKTTRFVRIIYSENETNKGLGYSLNRGVELCTNQIIFRMDSDDIMIPTRIQKQLEFMNNNPECGLCASQLQMFRNINNKIVDCGKTNHKFIFTWKDFLDNKSNHWITNHATWCFRKREILEVGNYNKSLHSMCEDFELILRVLKKYGKIYCLNDILYYYRLHENGLTYNGGKEGSLYWNIIRNEIIYKIINNIEEKPIINLQDKCVIEEPCFIKTDKIEITRKNPKNNDIVIFTDYLINQHNDNFKNIALLIESPEITQQSYNYVLNNVDKYDLVLTHNKKILDINNDKVKLNLYGTTWLHESYQKLYDKSKLCSIISSNKTITSGHKLRHVILEYLVKENIDVDKFGGNFKKLSGTKSKIYTIEHSWKHITNEKILGLKDYMFSITIENCKEDYYFSEKLIDCLLSGTVPIYWGCPSICDFFNIKGMIIFDTLDELKDILNNLTIEKYKSMEIYIKENFEKAKEYNDYKLNEDEIIKLL
uniref:Uncharacterized protein n=1 Tax=viral metagenome TaxID=1070528 RepID=A0A6C0CYV5_9ZZZZ